MVLSSPDAAGRLPLEACLARRRSVREFAPSDLSEREVYFVSRDGAHRYVPQAHALEPAAPGDLRAALAAAALAQEWIAAAPVGHLPAR